MGLAPNLRHRIGLLSPERRAEVVVVEVGKNCVFVGKIKK